MGDIAQERLPEIIQRLERWVPRVGLSVFSSALMANLVVSSLSQWLPFAVISAFMGVASYYMLRVVLRFHLWIGNVGMTQERVKGFLVLALGVSGVFSLMLVIGLLVWPKSYVVTIMAITMPMGLMMSAVRIWKEISQFPQARA